MHVFRIGGNGTASPGAVAPGYDGVSRLSNRELVTAWYGAGVWQVGFQGAPRDDDGVAEHPLTTWGNTLGWNVQFGAGTCLRRPTRAAGSSPATCSAASTSTG